MSPPGPIDVSSPISSAERANSSSRSTDRSMPTAPTTTAAMRYSRALGYRHSFGSGTADVLHSIDDVCETIHARRARAVAALTPYAQIQDAGDDEVVAAPSSGASRHLPPAGGGKGMIRLAPRYVELATTTNFSFLRGASHPEELVARAAELGLAGIGVADRNTLAGVVRAHVYAREQRKTIGDMRVVTGARLSLCRWRARPSSYPKRPRRLWATMQTADGRQFARAQGRVPPEPRGCA